jgi:hypothetical protein
MVIRRDLLTCMLIAIPVAMVGCDRSPSQPAIQFTPVPFDFATMAELIDWDRPELTEAATALAEGDSLGAAQALLDHYLAHPPFEAPHGGVSDTVADADIIMGGTIILGSHGPAPLPDDPTWAEDPLGDVNWRYQLHTLRWLQPLLTAHRETGDRSYLDRFMFLFRDYMIDNLVASPPSDMTWYDMAASLRCEFLVFYWRELLLLDEVDTELMTEIIIWIHAHSNMLVDQIPYLAAAITVLTTTAVSSWRVWPWTSTWRHLGGSAWVAIESSCSSSTW